MYEEEDEAEMYEEEDEAEMYEKHIEALLAEMWKDTNRIANEAVDEAQNVVDREDPIFSFSGNFGDFSFGDFSFDNEDWRGICKDAIRTTNSEEHISFPGEFSYGDEDRRTLNKCLVETFGSESCLPCPLLTSHTPTPTCPQPTPPMKQFPHPNSAFTIENNMVTMCDKVLEDAAARLEKFKFG